MLFWREFRGNPDNARVLAERCLNPAVRLIPALRFLQGAEDLGVAGTPMPGPRLPSIQNLIVRALANAGLKEASGGSAGSTSGDHRAGRTAGVGTSVAGALYEGYFGLSAQRYAHLMAQAERL